MRFSCQLCSILELKNHQNRVLEASWGVLGASWRPLGAVSGHVLGRFGRVLERLGGVLERLGRVLSTRPQVRSSAWPRFPPNNQDEERLTVERLPTERLQKTFVETECLWTPTRSWAPSGPVRIQRAAELRTRHRA